MSAFDPEPTNPQTPSSGAGAVIAKIKAVAKAYPYPTFVVLAFLALGVVSFLVAAFRGPAAPAPAAVTVPAAPAPSVTPTAAPGPAAGFAGPSVPAQAPAAAVGAVVLPPTHGLDAQVERGSSLSLSVETSGDWNTQKQTWVEVSTVSVAPADSVAGFTYTGAKSLLASVWPAPREWRRIMVTGLAKIDTPGTYTLVLSADGQQRSTSTTCEAELGPTGNVIASIANQSQLTAVERPLDAGFYRVAVRCATRLWDNENGGATLALRTAGDSPRVIELFKLTETTEPAPVAAPSGAGPAADAGT